MKCKFCDKDCKNDNSLRNHERLCKLNPNRQLTTYEKYGPIKNFNTKGKKAWNKGLTKNTSIAIKKGSESLKQRYKEGTLVNPQKGKSRTDEEKIEISNRMLKICQTRNCSLCGKGKRGYYKGYYCQSSWELAYVIYNIEHGIKFIRNKQGFSYVFENKKRTYFPDFYLLDSDTYVEIKGYYDRRSKEKTKQFKHNLIVLEFEDMKPILNYCINKYGKDFIRLYEITY